MQAAAAAARAGHPLSSAKLAAAQTAITDHALSVGFSRAFIVGAGITLLAFVITVITIRVRREDMQGVNPMHAPE
jgi:heme/copper-type cytochrome/quinol oxidase subunit 2